MNIISIDPSKFSTGIFLRSGKEEYCLTIKNKKSWSQGFCLQNIYREIMFLLKNEKIDFGLIEGYSFNLKRPGSISVLGEVCGVIKLAFSQMAIELVTVNTQIWKSKIKIKSKKSNKKKYIEEVKNKLNYQRVIKNTDEADALMIYNATKILCKEVKNQSEASEKVRKKVKDLIDRL